MCLLSFTVLIKSPLFKKLLKEEEKIVFGFVPGASHGEEDVNWTFTGPAMKTSIILWSIWMLRGIMTLDGAVKGQAGIPPTKQATSVQGGGPLARALKGSVPSFLNVLNTQVVFINASHTWNSPLV